MLKQKISAPLAIGIILILSVALGSFTILQYSETQKELAIKLPEIKLLEKKSDAECKQYAEDNCPNGCIVCPPCEYCSSISCNSAQLCKKMGFDESWYEGIKIQRETAGLPVDSAFVAESTSAKEAALATQGWQTYRNEEIGIEFKYPGKYRTDEVKDDGEKGKRTIIILGPPGYTYFTLSAYTSDYKPPQDEVAIFTNWTGTDEVVKNCPNPLEYNSKHICKIIEVAQKKAVFETILTDTGAYCDFNAIIYFNNLGNNQYKGLNFEHYFPGIVTKVCDFLPRYVIERNGGDIGNWSELESNLYSEYYSQTKNLMELKNLSEKDSEMLNILYQMLSTFKFID